MGRDFWPTLYICLISHPVAPLLHHWDVHLVRDRGHSVVLLPREQVQPYQMDLGVAVFAGLGGGEADDAARMALEQKSSIVHAHKTRKCVWIKRRPRFPGFGASPEKMKAPIYRPSVQYSQFQARLTSLPLSSRIPWPWGRNIWISQSGSGSRNPSRTTEKGRSNLLYCTTDM